jgi:hypothetical protein
MSAEDEFPPQLLDAAKAILKKLPTGDPVLVMNWNDIALADAEAADPNHNRQALIDVIMANGGADPENTQYIFHFSDLGKIQRARRQLMADHFWAFGTTPEMEQLGLDHRSVAAETMVISRITPRTIDLGDARFFYL